MIFILHRMIPSGLLLLWTCLIAITEVIDSLENGLALTPPMGWLAWQRYRCITDCETYPDECVKLVNINVLQYIELIMFINALFLFFLRTKTICFHFKIHYLYI